VQRLFSIFPNGWPGAGLFILRLAAGGSLAVQGVICILPGSHCGAITPAILGIAAGLLILIGLWTPVGSLIAAISESWTLLVGGIVLQTGVLLLSITVAIAMLGPGSRSIDAVLFGRRRLDLKD
jgi:putative oxidoreductase